MQKTIVLTPFELTESKKEVLAGYRSEALDVLHKHIIPHIDDAENSGELQQKVYRTVRNVSNLHSQVVLNLIRNSMSLKEKPPEKRNVRWITLDCNIPRAGKVFTLDSGTFCVKLNVAPRVSVTLPIKRNRMLNRFDENIANGWQLKQISITAQDKVLTVIEKRKQHIKVENILGIDVNANNITATVIDKKGRILKQLYFGKGVWTKKARILKRKSKLQYLASKGSSRADRSLKLLKRKLKNFTGNSTGEIAKQIHELAVEYNAKIVMERLTKFIANKNRKANRKISLIPFKLIREKIIIRSIDDGIPLGYVDPYHTSKWCPRCGSVNPAHNSRNYAIYRCKGCGLIVNSDRKASYAVAIKKLVERKTHTNPNYMLQTSIGGVPVNGLFRRNDGV